MSIWSFILLLVGINIVYVLLVFGIAMLFNLNDYQTKTLIDIGGGIMVIIGFCLGFYFGGKIV